MSLTDHVAAGRSMQARLIDVAGLQALIDALLGRGFTVVGPTVGPARSSTRRSRVSTSCPAAGVTSRTPGHYRLRRRDDAMLFGFASGAQSAKPVFFPTDEVLWRGERSGGEFTVQPDEQPARDAPYALIGVRSCDLSAVGIHDTVLLSRMHQDTSYASRRSSSFIVAVTCSDPGGTCFCVSMGTGPHPEPGRGAPYDLALTELLDGDGHRFVVEVASEYGADVLDEIGAARTSRRPEARRPCRRGRRRTDGPRARHVRAEGAALRERREPDLGRRRRPLPVLHQLHGRLPDLLLHQRGGRDRPRPATCRTRHGSGTRASTRTSPTSTAAPSVPRRSPATGSG